MAGRFNHQLFVAVTLPAAIILSTFVAVYVIHNRRSGKKRSRSSSTTSSSEEYEKTYTEDQTLDEGEETTLAPKLLSSNERNLEVIDNNISELASTALFATTDSLSPQVKKADHVKLYEKGDQKSCVNVSTDSDTCASTESVIDTTVVNRIVKATPAGTTVVSVSTSKEDFLTSTASFQQSSQLGDDSSQKSLVASPLIQDKMHVTGDSKDIRTSDDISHRLTSYSSTSHEMFDDSSNDSALELTTGFQKKLVLNGKSTTHAYFSDISERNINQEAKQTIEDNDVAMTASHNHMESKGVKSSASSNSDEENGCVDDVNIDDDDNRQNEATTTTGPDDQVGKEEGKRQCRQQMAGEETENHTSRSRQAKSHHTSGDSAIAASPEHPDCHPYHDDFKMMDDRSPIESPMSSCIGETDKADSHGSPAYSANSAISEESSDSGKGSCCNGVSTNQIMMPNVNLMFSPPSSIISSPVTMSPIHSHCPQFEFEIPTDLVGRLIGRGGTYIKDITNKTSARVLVQPPSNITNTNICRIQGTQKAIDRALAMIRKRFPISEFPELTLQQVNIYTAQPPTTLVLPPGTLVDVIMSSFLNAGHFFLQQPYQPTYQSLHFLSELMTTSYTEHIAPQIAVPQVGMIVAAPVMGGWYRALIVDVQVNDGQSEAVTVKFVDYGGYSRMEVSALRQIRMDFMDLPFQASECYLSDICPTEGCLWSPEANVFFEQLAQGQVLKAMVTGMTTDGGYLVRLYGVEQNYAELQEGIEQSTSHDHSSTPDDSSSSSDSLQTITPLSSSSVFVNEELVKAGYAKWINPPVSYLPSDGTEGCKPQTPQSNNCLSFVESSSIQEKNDSSVTSSMESTAEPSSGDTLTSC